jgi:hypothetical protein
MIQYPHILLNLSLPSFANSKEPEKIQEAVQLIPDMYTSNFISPHTLFTFPLSFKEKEGTAYLDEQSS